MSFQNGGGFLGGLGKPGSRESTQVNVQTQITIPWLRFVSIWGVLSGVLFSLYLIFKMFIWTRNDWAILIWLVTLGVFGYSIIKLTQNPLVRLGGRLVNLQYVVDLMIHNWIVSVFVVMLFVVSVVVFVDWVVPVITLTLDQQWYIILAICIASSLIISARSLIHHHKLNLENSLYDSSENVFMHNQDLTLKMIQYLDERGELDRFDEMYGRVIASRPMPVNGKRIIDMLSSQDLKAQRESEQIESKVPEAIQAPAGIEGYSKRRGRNIFVSNDKVYKFLKEINGQGTKTAARADWEGANKVDWLSITEWEALVDVLERVGMLGADKRLLVPYAVACDALGVPLPQDAQDAVQSSNSSTVPSRPASVPSRPILANTGNAVLDSAVNDLPGIYR